MVDLEDTSVKKKARGLPCVKRGLPGIARILLARDI